jgi:hypothetical protein
MFTAPGGETVSRHRLALNEDQSKKFPNFERTLMNVNEERSTTLP